MTSPWLIINGRRTRRSKVVARARARHNTEPAGPPNGGNGPNGPPNGPENGPP